MENIIKYYKTSSKIADFSFNSRSNLCVVSAFVSFTKCFPHSLFSLEQITELNYLLGMMSTCDGCHDTVCALKLFTVLFPSALPKESHVTVRLFEQQKEQYRDGVIYIKDHFYVCVYVNVYIFTHHCHSFSKYNVSD